MFWLKMAYLKCFICHVKVVYIRYWRKIYVTPSSSELEQFSCGIHSKNLWTDDHLLPTKLLSKFHESFLLCPVQVQYVQWFNFLCCRLRRLKIQCLICSWESFTLYFVNVNDLCIRNTNWLLFLKSLLKTNKKQQQWKTSPRINVRNFSNLVFIEVWCCLYILYQDIVTWLYWMPNESICIWPCCRMEVPRCFSALSCEDYFCLKETLPVLMPLKYYFK